MDPVDWIELIPFNETRNYVQRVLGNLQVYRLRLPPGKVTVTLTQDLRR
jgi:soluble lytic murein transglycosylase